MNSEINELKNRLSEVESEILLLKTSEDLKSAEINTATDSSFLVSLSVLGNTILGDTVVNGVLDVGILSFDNLAGSINSIGPLKLQPLALGSIEFVGNIVEINKDGNFYIRQGVISGNDMIRGVIDIKEGGNKVTVDVNWESPPASIQATPNYETDVWVSDVGKEGFTLNSSRLAPYGAKIYWFAIW